MPKVIFSEASMHGSIATASTPPRPSAEALATNAASGTGTMTARYASVATRVGAKPGSAIGALNGVCALAAIIVNGEP